MLCQSVRKLPRELCPSEWQHVLNLLGLVWKLEPQLQIDLAWLADPTLTGHPARYREWLGCPVLCGESRCHHEGRVTAQEVRWRAAVLRRCAAIDAGRRVLFRGHEARPQNPAQENGHQTK